MIVSMTGFGSASLRADDLEASVSIRSLNHRYLDVSVQLSRRLAALEPEVRRLVQSRLARGKVEASVFGRFGSGEGEGVRAAEPVVASLVSTLRRLKDTHRLQGDVSVSDVTRFPGALDLVEVAPGPDLGRARAVLGLVEQALAALVAMRRAEGESLGRELSAALGAIEQLVARLGQLSEEGKAVRRAALAEKVRELTAGLGLEEARLQQEVVRVVERAEVSEELARLRSHVAQCREAIASEGACGKRLDFLAQELMREANTIGSKAPSADAIREVVALKGEIERFREQVQNVE